MMYSAIPDMKHVITDIFAVKDMVVARFFVQGTHQAELEGIAPTGKKVVISGISIFRIKDGQVVEEIEDANMLGFYQQLGMELKPKEPRK
jgi:predicted ester cyclase